MVYHLYLHKDGRERIRAERKGREKRKSQAKSGMLRQLVLVRSSEVSGHSSTRLDLGEQKANAKVQT